ncbi:DUF5719 family protein [uncultured Pseudokineococcus sp.]|uniref:DUF5719 family protein n=1 Tax=uncultured Pseudokineococcus sp. TaxID=1642928 RepID=UPI0026078C9C|nr:DUF5719 family protein [uncultured Pseudokineococcus sp.]
MSPRWPFRGRPGRGGAPADAALGEQEQEQPRGQLERDEQEHGSQEHGEQEHGAPVGRREGDAVAEERDGAARGGWTPPPPTADDGPATTAEEPAAADAPGAGAAAAPAGAAAAGDGTAADGTADDGAADDEGRPAGTGSRTRPSGRRVAAAVVAVALVLAAAGAAAAGTALRGDEARRAAPAGGVVSVGSGVATSSLGCPGGPVLAAAPAGTDGDFAAVVTPPDARLTAVAAGLEGPLAVAPVAAAASSTTTGADPAPGGETPSVDGTVAAAGSGGAAAVSATGVAGEAAPSLAALATTVTPDGDLQGVAAATCPAPTSDAWLVGGATDAGTSTRLVLVNPGSTAAEVGVEVLTEDGVEQPAAGQGVVVPAGQRTELLVEGLVGGAEALAVHVTSTGGSVAPSLVVTRLAGLVPRGVEVVAPAAAPALAQVVPGVATEGRSTAVLRLAVPGSEPADVEWDVLADDAGAEAAADLSAGAAVPAGTVVDVPLGGLPAGSAAVAVRSDVPVVASVVLERLSGAEEAGPADLAVAPATDPLSVGAALALPAAAAGLTSAVLLTNATEEPATLSLAAVAPDGARADAVEVDLEPRSTARAPAGLLDGAAGLLVTAVDAPGATAAAEGAEGEPSGGVHAALVLSAAEPAGAVAVAVPSAVPAAAGSTPVLVAAPGRWP